jgi:hypothetical protein
MRSAKAMEEKPHLSFGTISRIKSNRFFDLTLARKFDASRRSDMKLDAASPA